MSARKGRCLRPSYWRITDPATHPLRDLRRLVDPLLRDLSPTFDTLSSGTGRPSIPPEQPLNALLLQLLYAIRSERQLVEQLEYHRLYRWFVGLDREAKAWHATTFTKNRRRLLDGTVAAQVLARVIGRAEAAQMGAREHGLVDGTLREAWASQKSVRPLDDDDRDRPGRSRQHRRQPRVRRTIWCDGEA